MDPIVYFFKCFSSPALYNIHRTNLDISGKYEANKLEKWGDNILGTITFFWHLGITAFPLVVLMVFRRGFLSAESAQMLAKFSIGLSVVIGASYTIRSYGRSQSTKYRLFVDAYNNAKKNLNANSQKELRSFDYEFSAWPVDYTFTDFVGKKSTSTKQIRRTSWSYLLTSPCSLIGYTFLHTVGIRMIYPGSTTLLNYLLAGHLVEGRSHLINNHRGQRLKIKTSGGNFLDVMFVDKRGFANSGTGSTLIVCSEGNAGFYEIGIMTTPVDDGYSVLGWNHPGFGGSTGMPYPDQEKDAMDAVMQLAITKLGFMPENIVLFGWSIGGFATSWAAMNYPDVKAVMYFDLLTFRCLSGTIKLFLLEKDPKILDASFDDLLPLAVPRMPKFLEPMVHSTIRQYANLDIARQLGHYQGPVLIIRRTEDEVICIVPNDISTNRGNDLLIHLLKQRYPNLFKVTTEPALIKWLATTGNSQARLLESYNIHESECKEIINSYVAENSSSFPMTIGEQLDDDLKIKLLLYLASKHMVDYASTHCTQLPKTFFQIPSFLNKE